MKFGNVLDAATAASLQLEWLAAELDPVSEYGRRFFETLRPFAAGDEASAEKRARAVDRFAGAVDEGRLDSIRETLRGAHDISPAVARAGMGDVLSDVNFLEVQRFCDALAQAGALLRGHDVVALPACREVAAALERGRSGKFGFYLDDAFDAGLAAARFELRAAQTAFERARSSLGRETDEFIIMRADAKGALPPGIRVIREAPTYFLCEAELDADALDALARRDAAAQRAAGTEHAARARLSAVIRENGAALEAAARAMGELDFFVAAARWTQRYDCTAATYQCGKFEFDDGRFLPVQAELERQHLTYTPISVSLPDVAVLTGPNMGGKSVALRTCGFIAACASLGLPVPAARASVPLFGRIAWLGIGIREETGGLLSSFASEVVRLRDAMAQEAKLAVMLIDEFARTTTPDEGRALLLALVANLRKRGVRAFISTHLPGIASAAGVAHYAVRGLSGTPPQTPQDTGEVLASLARSMDYAIEPVSGDREPSADAIVIAALLGLDPELIESAWQMLRRGETETA